MNDVVGRSARQVSQSRAQSRAPESAGRADRRASARTTFRPGSADDDEPDALRGGINGGRADEIRKTAHGGARFARAGDARSGRLDK